MIEAGRLRRAFRAAFAFLAALFARLLVATLRVSRLGPDPASLPRPCIYAFAHGRQAALHRFPRPQTAAVASRSPDGRLQARILRAFGFHVIDGSSSRGGPAALGGALRHLREGRCVAMAVDGPRGPRGVVQPGVIWLAARSGAPIVPLSAAARPARRFRRAWDGFLLPLPFARATLVAGSPVSIPSDADPEHRERARHALEVELGRLAGRADRTVE